MTTGHTELPAATPGESPPATEPGATKPATLTTPAPAARAAATDEAVLCPRCGFDLRGTTAERCGECGLKVDRAALGESGVPWAHRQRVGRVRTFLKTVWMVVMDTWALRREMAKPQDPRDAGRFGWCVGTLAAAGLLAVWGIGIYEDGLGAYALQLRSDAFARTASTFGGSGSAGGPDPVNGLLQDAIVPWAAGMAAWPVLPLCLIALAFYLVGVPRAALRLSQFPPEHQAKGRALATYASAPLALLAVAGGLAWGIDLLSHRLEVNHYLSPLQLTEGGLGILLAITVLTVAVAGPMRAAQWRARARHGGLAVVLLSAAEVIVRWGVGTVVWLGFFPWVVGYAWLAFDSLR